MDCLLPRACGATVGLADGGEEEEEEEEGSACEQNKQKDIIECDMLDIIKDNTKLYQSIIEFNININNIVCRQDSIMNGLKPNVNSHELYHISLRVKSHEHFDAKMIYDTDIYLTELIMRAHMLDHIFQKEMKQVFPRDNTHTDTSVLYHGGPIKSIARCREKAIVEYGDKAWPRSACIIDIINN